MISTITFFLGLSIGCFFAVQRQVQIEKQKEKRKFSEEIELRATPDTYLSEFDLLRKRYYEAKFKKMTEPRINLKGIAMTTEEIKLRQALERNRNMPNSISKIIVLVMVSLLLASTFGGLVLSVLKT